MLQASDATLDDFDGHEGCNEILNVTRPDIVRTVHEGYLEAKGWTCVTTNTFGANLSNLGEYGLSGRIAELSEAGARIAREAADQWSSQGARAGCSAPWGREPAADPRPTRFADLRDAYQLGAAGLISGGPMRSSSRPARTCSRPRPPSSAPGGR